MLGVICTDGPLTWLLVSSARWKLTFRHKHPASGGVLKTEFTLALSGLQYWELKVFSRAFSVGHRNPSPSLRYSAASREDPLTFLLALNAELADREADGQPVVGPGLPPAVVSAQRLVIEDRITVV